MGNTLATINTSKFSPSAPLITLVTTPSTASPTRVMPIKIQVASSLNVIIMSQLKRFTYFVS